MGATKHCFDRLAVHYHLVNDPSHPKSALAAAQQIESMIARQGWVMGAIIGSERALRARFGLGHRVVREAIRVLQSRSAIQARRGSQGGLMVGRPSRSMAISAIADYLEAITVNESELNEARTVLAKMATPPIAMTAIHIGDIYIGAVEEVQRRRAIGTRPRSAEPGDRDLSAAPPTACRVTRSARVAQSLLLEIEQLRREGKPLRLGSEQVLSERHGVGLAVLRQALRILDARGITESHRGRMGGVIGRVPPARGAIETTLTYLSMTRLDQLELLSWVAAFDDALNTLAVERWSDDDQRRSEALLSPAGVSRGYWKALLTCVQWDACGNRVLALVARTTAAYQVRFVPDGYHIRQCDRAAYQVALLERARAMSRQDLQGTRDAIHNQSFVLERVVERLLDRAAVSPIPNIGSAIV
jgi:DNA-binding FadR family transcriptional regulator